MPKITYVEFDGTQYTVDVDAGLTVMEGALRNDVPGIDGDCGGACACATCHVYIASTWNTKIGARSTMEDSMLDFASDVNEDSRLSCQIRITPEMDGLEVHMPEEQG